MATTTKNYKTEMVPVTTMVEKRVEDGVTLHLTYREALVVKAVLGKIVGGGKNGSTTNDVFEALASAGVPGMKSPDYNAIKLTPSLIWIN